MNLSELVEAHGGQAEFARRIGCSRSYLNHVMADRKKLGPAMAVRIFNATGVKLGPLADQPRVAA